MSKFIVNDTQWNHLGQSSQKTTFSAGNPTGVIFDSKEGFVLPEKLKHDDMVKEMSQPVNRDQIFKWHEEARGLFSRIEQSNYLDAETKDKLDEAIRLLTKAINLDKTLSMSAKDFGLEEIEMSEITSPERSAWLHFDRGVCNVRLKNYEAAVHDFTKEIQLHQDGPGLFRSLYERGFCYKEMKKYDEALNDFRRIPTIKGIDKAVLKVADREIGIVQSQNTYFDYFANKAAKLRNYITELGTSDNVLGLPEIPEKEFLSINRQQAGKIINHMFDIKKKDLEKFSELLRDSGALKGDLGNRLSKSFVTLSEIKKLIPEGATADSDYILNFINLYEGKTKKAYDNKLPDNQFKISGTKQLDHKLQGQEL